MRILYSCMGPSNSSFPPVQRGLVLTRDPQLQLKVHTAMCSDVGILRVFPGITATTVSSAHPHLQETELA